LFIKCEGII